MHNRVIALAFVAAFAGCSTANTLYTPVPQRGQTADQTQSDVVACEKVAYDVKEKPHVSSGSLLGWWIDESSYKRAYQECMSARGYALKD